MAEKDGNPEGADRAAPPSLTRQKTFIVENAAILDKDTKTTILRLIMMDIGESATHPTADGQTEERPVVQVNGVTQGVSVNLDNIRDPEVILRIYNIVRNRREVLNTPAHGSKR